MNACVVTNCGRQVHGHGHCAMHYKRLRRTGTTDGVGIMTTEERLARYSDRTDSCWFWTGYINRNGYGNCKTETGRQSHAHIVSYEHYVGPVPAGLVLDHLCRERTCINPAHLEAVTQSENMARGALSWSMTGGKCRKKLHDVTDPINVGTTKDGSRWCKPCAKMRAKQEVSGER